MAIKDLLVHLDTGARTAARLQLAASLARTHGACLTGLFGQRALAEVVGVIATWPSAEYVAAAAASKAAFEQATRGIDGARWQDVNRGGDAELLRLVTEAARYHDLTIVGQHDGSADAPVPGELAETLVVQSGRPVLVVPYVGGFPQVARRPLIAWDASRQAAHALNDALPLIAGCDEAVVVSLDRPFDAAEAALQEVARHLAAHGIRARTEVMAATEIRPLDFLLNRITDVGADLLVVGAHRHTALPTKEYPVDARAVMQQLVVPTFVSR